MKYIKLTNTLHYEGENDGRKIGNSNITNDADKNNYCRAEDLNLIADTFNATIDNLNEIGIPTGITDFETSGTIEFFNNLNKEINISSFNNDSNFITSADITTNITNINNNITTLSSNVTTINNTLNTHINNIASTTELGHIKIDGNTLKINNERCIILYCSRWWW